MSVERTEATRSAIVGPRHAPAAASVRVADPVTVVLVEGVSDLIAVETLAARRGRDLTAERVAVVPTGGAGGIRGALADHAQGVRHRAVLCDAGEADYVHRVITASGRVASLFVCDPDLEAELIRAVGVDRTLAILDSQGDLGSFRTLQKQAPWRDRPAEAQLRRFFGAGARRKLRYAGLLTDAAVDIDSAPRPLVAALDASRP